MTIEELRVLITAQTNQLQQQVSGVRRQLTGLDQHTQRTCKSMSKAFSAIKLTAIIGGLTLLVKKTTEVASNLQEVQNVVDTTFGDMAYKVEEFSKTAVRQFGLSELSAKKAASTFMAMSNGIGVRQDYGADMAITLAGLAGDLASFWNTTNEQAQTALKGVYTGETEALKQYGIVMTEAALQSYALSQGIKTNISDMTQQEKVILRYNYILQATADAQGDFAKTSDSWANQTRILKEQFQQLLGVLGKGFIAALTPAVKALNDLLAVVIDVANAISESLGRAFGISYETMEVDTSGVEQGMGDISSGADDATDSVEDLQKQLNLLSFDEINKLNDTKIDSSNSGGNLNLIPNTIDNENSIANRLEEQTPEIQRVLEGWKKSFKQWIEGLPKIDIKFNLDAAKHNLQLLADYAGKVFYNVSQNISTSLVNLLNSIDFDYIITKLSVMAVDILSIIDNLVTVVTFYFDNLLEDLQFERVLNQFAGFIASITDLLSSLVSSISIGLVDAYKYIQPLVEWIGTHLIEALDFATKQFQELDNWVIQNSLGIQNLTVFVGQLVGALWALVEPLADVAFEAFKIKIEETLDILKESWSYILNEIVPKLQQALDQFINETMPVVNDLAKQILETIDLSIPLLELLATVITDILAPVVGEYLVFNFKLALNAIQGVIIILDSLVQGIKGVVEIIKGIFEGDWGMAWQGAVDVVDAFVWAVAGLFDKLSDIVADALTGITDAIKSVFDGLGNIFSFGGSLKGVPGISGYSIPVNYVPADLPELANGGVIYSETVAKIGEYPGARSNPEIVTPQNILKETMEVANAGVINAVVAMGNKITKAVEDKDTNVYMDSVKVTKKVMSTEKEITNKKGDALIIRG